MVSGEHCFNAIVGAQQLRASTRALLAGSTYYAPPAGHALQLIVAFAASRSFS
jgi:hypothetical protein